MNTKRSALTKHAVYRMKQRRIPEALIHEAVRKGRKVFLPCRNAVEYRMNNVLGIRGANLVVVTGIDGTVLTSYVERVPVRRK